MLNRRYLRIKVMQTLYSFFQDEEKNINARERELKTSIDKIYELYLYLLLLLCEIRRTLQKTSEERKRRLVPSAEDLNPNTRFVNDPALLKIDSSPSLAARKNERKLSWGSDEDPLIKELITGITGSKEYIAYMDDPEYSESFEKSREFIHILYKKYISENEVLKQHLFDKNMHWSSDYHLANICVLKTIKNLTPDKDIELMPLYKECDDEEFMLKLFRHTILDENRTSALINQKISNWDPERIAAIDMLLMKMAITEILTFPNIPIKVTLNEYIEISKQYSSPKSNTFINGILDAVVKELRIGKKLEKTGRGLME